MSSRERRDCRCLRVRHEHGTRQAYKRDLCGCAPCSAANAEHGRQLRRRHAQSAWRGVGVWTTSAGTVRRLQALAAAGWTLPELGQRLGVCGEAVANLRNTEQDRVLTATAERVEALYDALWHVTPPAGKSSTYAANKAARHGWAEPWQWDGVDIDDPSAEPAVVLEDLDEVAVERAMLGEPSLTLTRAERIEAIRRLADAGHNDVEIGRRLGITHDAVLKIRERAGIAAGQPIRRAA
jgi:transcriptional regulator with XRE-family HTH domain